MSVAVKGSTDHSNVLAVLLSLSPLYFLVQAKSKLGLDGLHISMLQIVLLLCLRWVLSFDPRRALQSSSTTPTLATTDAPNPTANASKRRRRANRAPVVKESLYSPAQLDTITCNFLRVTEPSYTTLLPAPLPSSTPQPAPASLSTWKCLYQADGIEVLLHPTAKALYAVVATYQDVPLRKLFATLIDVEKRKEWDGMCSGVEALDEINVGGRRGACSWLAMKGVGLIKAKDMVLISVAGRLPPNKSEDHPALRLFCATSSFDHPRCQPKPGFNRMVLNVAGFIAEEHGSGGSKITQITDLSGLGSWVPSSVLNLVTQTMIPKSLAKLGRCAAAYDLSQDAFPAEGDEWLPPLLGSTDDSLPKSDAAASELVQEDDESASDDDSDDESGRMSPAASRDLHTLVGEIRTLTSRLSQLESSGSASWFGMEQLTIKKLGLVGTGGAVGAAVAVAALAIWGRRRRN